MGMLDGLEPVKIIRPCKTRNIIESLDKADREILVAALADHAKWSSNQLSRALAERGIDVKPDTLNTHRRRQCSCSKT